MLLPRFLAKDQWRRRLFSMRGTLDFLSLVLEVARRSQTLLMSLSLALRSGSVTDANWRDPRILSWALRDTLGVLRNVRTDLVMASLFSLGRDNR